MFEPAYRMPNFTSTTNGCLETDLDAEQPKIIIHVAMGMVALLSVCGIIGNALVILAFSRQKHKLSSTIFILTLAVTDFLTSLITMPYTVVIELMDFYIWYDFPCKLYQFMKTTTIPFSAFVMVAIALDRYLCIVYPFKHIMTIKRAKITVATLALLAFVIGVICSLMIGTYHIVPPDKPECIVKNDNSSQAVIYRSEPLSSSANLTVMYEMHVPRNSLEGTVDNITKVKPQPGDIVQTGMCRRSHVIFGPKFFGVYQHLYSSLFGVCAVMVIILYGLTYRSVLAHRRKRLNISNKCCGILSRNMEEETTIEHNECTTLHNVEHSPATNGKDRESIRMTDTYRERAGTVDSTGNDTNGQSQQNNHNNKPETDAHIKPAGVSRAKLKRLRVANIKTALMLSIVAFIYILAFTPAWMMALHVLSMNVIVYYLYFTYNVANPVIYAFLNNNFRTHLQAMFHCRQ
ncbi:substance-K receptor-like isoform X1 [Mya arenaria]|uniref:substance-K receptor-like isoform X1 n=1 Tax=Mya arenaria TaxID=6604 RepID=UPI0022DFCECC|nr:substance-K receptor-like isoform X1 [Mya arenaria]